MNLIREMKESDWKRVGEIYSEALEEGISTFNRECPSYEDWNASHLKDCRFVIEADGDVQGWCVLSPTSSRDSYKGVAEVSIYIDKKFRDRGLGTELLNNLCRVSEEKGYWCIYAAVLAVNPASIALHKKCCFREVGYRERIAKDRFGNWQNTIIFEKRSSVI